MGGTRRGAVLVTVTLAIAAAAAARAGPAERPAQSVAVGDFDGDGVPDVAVGLPDLKVGKAKQAGEVRIYSGKTGKFVRAHSGVDEGDGFGTAIAAVGDVDGDGATDLAISAPFSRPRVDFVSGATGKRIYLFNARSAVGWADRIVSLGDGSGKTRVDVAIRHVKVNENTLKEEATWRYVYSDNEAMGCAHVDDGGSATSGRFVGDVNGDGKPDLAIVNASAEHDGREGAGFVKVVSGQFLWQGSREAVVLQLGGEREREGLGASLAAAGDWNGDGKGDVLLAVAGNPAKQEKAWTVRVHSGADGSVLWKAAGPPGALGAGGVAMAGDADGDGKSDVAVGTPDSKSKAAGVTLLAAKDGSVIWSVRSAANESLGAEILPAADADADGVRDLVVLAPGAAVDGKKGNGSVRILSGKTGATLCTINPLVTK